MENFRLRVFRTVARRLSFRVAAEELLLTQPAVSMQVKALEEELAAALFARTGGRISLTRAGLALLPFAEQMAQLSEEAREAVARVSDSTVGHLKLGASQTIGQYLLPRLIAGFLAAHPRTEIGVTGGNTQTVLEALRARQIQLALIEGPAFGHDVQVTPFLEDHMICVVPAAHEWADQEVSLEELKEARLLTRELGSGSRRIVEAGLEEAGIAARDLKVGMTFDSTEGLLGGVEAGLGIGIVSRWAVRNQLALGTLKVARVEGLRLRRMFALATLAGPAPGGTVGEFCGFVLERAEGLGRKGR